AELDALQGNFDQAKIDFDKATQSGEVVWQPGREGFYRAILATSGSERAAAAAALGDKETALQLLERQADIFPHDAAPFVRRPEFASLQAEPRFQALLLRMNLQP